MKIVFWGNGTRGEKCLQAIVSAGFDVACVVLHPSKGKPSALFHEAQQLGLNIVTPDDPHAPDVVSQLKSLNADVFVLAGYGKIIDARLIDIPKKMTINLHAGKLPEYRGSSPLNWALINGQSSVTLSVIKVDPGVDSGDVLVEKRIPVNTKTTIRDVHDKANVCFPQLLSGILEKLSKNKKIPVRKQDPKKAGYYPLRFPEDGIILWDTLTHMQIHNRIRALTEPYPMAFTYFNGRRVNLLASEIYEKQFFGEPGRIYLKTSRGLLIGAQDRCLWITSAVFADNGKPLADEVKRYDSLATVRGAVAQWQENLK